MCRWVLALVLVLCGPAQAAGASNGGAPHAGAHAAVTALPEELRERLHQENVGAASSASQRLRRLVRFMFEPETGLGLQYAEDATYDVGQAYAHRKVNCLTFTLLFLALAREVGLDAYPQELGETLSWHQDGGTLYRNSHVNAGVRIGNRLAVADVAGDWVIALHPPRRISHERLLSHYYNNLAIEHLTRNELPSAHQHMTTALSLAPTHATLWSNAGVLYQRSGDPGAAERAFLHALALEPDNAGALFNMIGLAHRLGDPRREADYRERLTKVQQHDPFHHFLQAMDFERVGDHAQAIAHYRRAIRLHRDEHRFHSALARAYLRAGDTRRAVKALARAQALSDGSTRAAYRTQLDTLRRNSN